MSTDYRHISDDEAALPQNSFDFQARPPSSKGTIQIPTSMGSAITLVKLSRAGWYPLKKPGRRPEDHVARKPQGRVSQSRPGEGWHWWLRRGRRRSDGS